jgi:hypothetical protein
MSVMTNWPHNRMYTLELAMIGQQNIIRRKERVLLSQYP